MLYAVVIGKFASDHELRKTKSSHGCGEPRIYNMWSVLSRIPRMQFRAIGLPVHSVARTNYGYFDKDQCWQPNNESTSSGNSAQASNMQSALDIDVQHTDPIEVIALERSRQ